MQKSIESATYSYAINLLGSLLFCCFDFFDFVIWKCFVSSVELNWSQDPLHFALGDDDDDDENDSMIRFVWHETN